MSKTQIVVGSFISSEDGARHAVYHSLAARKYKTPCDEAPVEDDKIVRGGTFDSKTPNACHGCLTVMGRMPVGSTTDHGR